MNDKAATANDPAMVAAAASFAAFIALATYAEVAPISTVDLDTPDGSKIPIEQRDAREVTHIAGKQMVPDGVLIENPAFDVTPARYITAIITERGIARAPYEESLSQ